MEKYGDKAKQRIKDREKAIEFFSGDLYATKTTGIVIDDVKEHYAKCSLEIHEGVQNAYGGVMGGAIFTLADYTFAVSSNFNAPQTVSTSSQINFLGMAKGKKLISQSTLIKDGKTNAAKLFFREAFFIDASKIELDNLDSPLIFGLVEKVSEEGYKGEELQEWIPVYGRLLEIFNIKRTLKAQEVGKLKQDIYSRENEIKNPANNNKLIKPRLFNMYLWLIDHYIASKENVKRIKEIVLSIKLLDAGLYKRFIE